MSTKLNLLPYFRNPQIPVEAGHWVVTTAPLPLGCVGRVDTVDADGSASVVFPLGVSTQAIDLTADEVAALRVLDLVSVRVRVVVGDDVDETSLACWARANEDMDDCDLAIAHMLKDGRETGGGGAAPRWSIAVTGGAA